MSEPVEVEVLDQEGRPLVEIKKHSLLNPFNVLIFLCACLFATGILLMAIGHLLRERARQKDAPPDPK